MSHSDVSAWVAAVIAASGTVSAFQESILDQLVMGWVADGTYAKLNFFWPHYVESSVTVAGAKIDVITRTTATNVGSPTWAALAGFTTNGTTSALDLGTTGGTAQNSASFGFDLLTNISPVAGVQMGVVGTIGVYICNIAVAWSDGIVYWACRDNNFDGGHGTPANRSGQYTISRTASTGAAAYRNGTLTADNGQTSIAQAPTENWYLGGVKEAGGGIVQASPGQFAMCFIGDGLSATDATNINSRWATYKAALSAGVPTPMGQGVM